MWDVAHKISFFFSACSTSYKHMSKKWIWTKFVTTSNEFCQENHKLKIIPFRKTTGDGVKHHENFFLLKLFDKTQI